MASNEFCLCIVTCIPIMATKVVSKILTLLFCIFVIFEIVVVECLPTQISACMPTFLVHDNTDVV